MHKSRIHFDKGQWVISNPLFSTENVEVVFLTPSLTDAYYWARIAATWRGTIAEFSKAFSDGHSVLYFAWEREKICSTLW